MAWKTLFVNSSRDNGTLGHFCSLLGRLPNAKNLKKDFNVCLNVLLTTVKGHFIAAACDVPRINKLHEEPVSLAEVKQGTELLKKCYITKVAREVVHRCCLFGDSLLDQAVPDQNCKDHVHNYAYIMCHFGSCTLEFMDAWCGGDGERIICCWGIFMLHFYAAKRTKYALQALHLKFQLASLPPSLAHQLSGVTL